jgi:hypothetical protein
MVLAVPQDRVAETIHQSEPGGEASGGRQAMFAHGPV